MTQKKAQALFINNNIIVNRCNNRLSHLWRAQEMMKMRRMKRMTLKER
jgi:hypothetical protein